MPSFTQDVELSAGAPRVWKAFQDAPVLLPKIAPQLFASIESHGPANEVGTERTVKFGTATPEGAFVKEKITAVDQNKFTIATEELEGGHLKQGFTKWAPTVVFAPVDDNNCKVTITVEYEGDNEASIAQAKQGFVKMYNGVTGYLNTSGAYA